MKWINNIGGYVSYVYSDMKIPDLIFVTKRFELENLKFEVVVGVLIQMVRRNKEYKNNQIDMIELHNVIKFGN